MTKPDWAERKALQVLKNMSEPARLAHYYEVAYALRAERRRAVQACRKQKVLHDKESTKCGRLPILSYLDACDDCCEAINGQ